MPPPAVIGKVYYTFSPPTDSWILNYRSPSEQGEITDEYIWRVWSPDVLPTGVAFSDQWGIARGPAIVSRVKMDVFSISSLPPPVGGICDSGYQNIIFLGYGLVTDSWFQYDPQPILTVDSDGKFSFTSTGTKSANSIVAATDYSLELYTYNDPAETNTTWQLWIDGVLWLSDDLATYNQAYCEQPYASCMCGVCTPTEMRDGPEDYNVHMHNIIWTLETHGFAHWTMMAPGIG